MHPENNQSSEGSPSGKWFQRNSNRKSISEKGINFKEEDGPRDMFIAQILQHYRWGLFARPPGSYCLEFVLEFYQNLNPETNIAMVKGRPVDFSPQTINSLFFLENVDDVETKIFLANPNWAVVEAELCPRGANWKYSVEKKVSKLLYKNIDYSARPHLTFIGSRLLPNSNSYDIYTPRVALLYAICKKMALNVGRFINANMVECRNDPLVRSLWYPSTITLLCKINGIKPTDNMISFKYSKIIDKSCWAKMENIEGPRGKEPLPDGVRSRIGGPARLQIEKLTEELGRLNVLLDNNEQKFDQRFENLEEKINHGFRRNEHIQMQDMMYNSFTNWNFSNMVKQMDESWNFTGLPDFPPIYWIDPDTTPIPSYYVAKNFETTEQQLAETPQTFPPVEYNPMTAMRACSLAIYQRLETLVLLIFLKSIPPP